ncbi:MAG: hypothetical protein ACE5GQ_10400 [Nitrospinales bacterium]
MIEHMKNDGRLGRNYLLGQESNHINAILCSALENRVFQGQPSSY